MSLESVLKIANMYLEKIKNIFEKIYFLIFFFTGITDFNNQYVIKDRIKNSTFLKKIKTFLNFFLKFCVIG